MPPCGICHASSAMSCRWPTRTRSPVVEQEHADAGPVARPGRKGLDAGHGLIAAPRRLRSRPLEQQARWDERPSPARQRPQSTLRDDRSSPAGAAATAMARHSRSACGNHRRPAPVDRRGRRIGVDRPRHAAHRQPDACGLSGQRAAADLDQAEAAGAQLLRPRGAKAGGRARKGAGHGRTRRRSRCRWLARDAAPPPVRRAAPSRTVSGPASSRGTAPAAAAASAAPRVRRRVRAPARRRRRHRARRRARPRRAGPGRAQ